MPSVACLYVCLANIASAHKSLTPPSPAGTRRGDGGVSSRVLRSDQLWQRVEISCSRRVHCAELSPRTFCTFPRELSSRRAVAPHRPRGVERREQTADDHVHADHGPPAAALRPPASASRPTHRRRDRRHGPRRPSLDGAWVAGRGADGRGLSGWCGPHGAGAPTGGPEAAATRPEAHGAAPARAGPATNAPGFTSQESVCRTDVPRYRSCAPWIGPASTSRCERSCGSCECRRVGSMPGAGAKRVCAGRSVLLSPHITVSTDAPRSPGDQGHGHLARLSARPDRHPRRPRPAARHGLGLALHLVPPRTAARLAPPPAPRASRRNRRSGFARREPTRCGTSTPPSSACSTGPAPTCTR